MADKQSIKMTASLILFAIIILSVIYATSPPEGNVLLFYLVVSSTSFLVYRFSSFQQILIPLSFSEKNHFGRSILMGAIAGGFFFFTTKLIPGLSLGLPLLPGTISETFKLVIIIVAAPFFEEIFFRGAVLGFFRNTSLGKKNVWFAIIGQAILFAFAHLGAYVLGFYNYPSFAQGLDAVTQNISAFMAAVIFGIVVGFFVTRQKTQNLWFAIIFHALLNLIIFTSLSVVFLG